MANTIAPTTNWILAVRNKGIAEWEKGPSYHLSAESYWNEAYDKAIDTRNVQGELEVANAWAGLAGNGWVASREYAQALGDAYYWAYPDYGTGSGSNWRYGYDEVAAVINDAGPLERALSGNSDNAGDVESIQANAVNAYNTSYLTLTQALEQNQPPVMGGTWSANIGGVTVAFTINQYSGASTGTFSTSLGTSGTVNGWGFTILPRGSNGWYYGSFEVEYSTGAVVDGYASISIDATNHMELSLWNGRQYLGFDAYRTY